MGKEKKIEEMDFSYLEKTAGCLKLVAHPMRLKIIEILSQGQFSVGNIAERCKLPPNQACEHLRLLKNAGLLDSKRDGRIVYYSIKARQLISLLECIKKNCPNE